MKILKNTMIAKPLATTTLLAVAALMMIGCGADMSRTSTTPVMIAGPHLSGSVFGGRQPIVGSTIHLYAASTSGYSATNTDLLTSTVRTTAQGTFNITSLYTCTAGQQIYITALGGDPGAGINAQAGLMAALGDCANLSPSTYISLNEITTVGAVFALAPFMASSTALGTSPTNTLGLKQAFVSANKLANVATGLAGGPFLAFGATVPVAEINTLADILAACVNSGGGASGDNSICGKEFNDATPAGGTAPTDTIGLALSIAKNPALHTASLMDYATATGPYHPQLSVPPNDFTLAITYTGGGLNAPKSTTIDAAGNVWVANSGNNTVTLLAQTGTPTSGSPFAGNGLSAPAAVAIDMSGNGWVANRGSSTVSVFTPSGVVVNGSPYSVGTAPASLAFDVLGNVFVGNSQANTVTRLSSTGITQQTISTGVDAPSAIAINSK